MKIWLVVKGIYEDKIGRRRLMTWKKNLFYVLRFSIVER